ncbi:MAG: tRNA uridine-5-carboxymethylaminomethyl(34) synthesis enzyme MnmG [Christensenellales bacterium]
MEKEKEFYYDSIVIGAGHAGCESALALARTGQKTLLLTLNLDAIAFLACNPSIGGTAKGHLVCEIDALGGQMGINADKTAVQIRMLNMGKGPAVHSLRAQADKISYHNTMKRTLENTPNLYIRQLEAVEITQQNGHVCSVKTAQGFEFFCKSVVVATGVYLKSRIIIGEYTKSSGPNGFAPANELTKSLIDLGLEIKRFKTGTPARVNSRTIDFSKTEEQNGDEDIQSFSFLTKKTPKNRAKCYLTYTNENTHKIIRDNLSRAPMFSGIIEGIGPRYCPSIEDKIVRFADKERHQVFLEPESLETNEIYLQGVSTSLPVDVQEQMYRTIAGLENVEIMRNAYAIEYDAIESTQLRPTLECKCVKGLFFAGQVNGTSGYEEAAAQGLVAGINASLFNRGEEQLVLKRSDAYIGVLIDDLVTKGTNEPYRMMTSRAEYRLWLRQDNADVRLTEIGRRVGLVDDHRYEIFQKKMKKFEKMKQILQEKIKFDQKLIDFCEKVGEIPPRESMKVGDLLKRTNITAKNLNQEYGLFKGYNSRLIDDLNTFVKYEGYINQQLEDIEKAKKNQSLKIPEDFDYSAIKGLRIEAIQKLSKIRPLDIGQASRISGVSPADIAVLSVMIKMKK